MSSIPWSVIGLGLLGIVFQLLYYLKHKEVEKLKTLRRDVSKIEVQEAQQFRMTTQRVIREHHLDDNFCRTCKAVVRPAGHFCYSCGLAYPLKKDTK